MNQTTIDRIVKKIKKNVSYNPYKELGYSDVYKALKSELSEEENQEECKCIDCGNTSMNKYVECRNCFLIEQKE